MKTQIDDIIRHLAREVQMRKNVYARKVETGAMTPIAATAGIRAMQDTLEYVTRCSAVMAELGQYGESLFNGRRGVPSDGPYHSLDTGAKSEAHITIEMLKEARALRAEFGQKTPPPPQQQTLL